ncbi:unnamed protein product [Dibothriocephalus latus]|uniref:Uncharacterized protein n=1 Tax=Dibothriocephalus latus TaxID=60516 RepID=A0A3P7NZN3_DIBLA|nr:unnamed protein product [Dibothriocephalus latus]
MPAAQTSLVRHAHMHAARADIIEVLADRALRGRGSSCRFFWVSRWAVTNKSTLFYTLEEALLPVENQLDTKMKITELFGATSTIGEGRVLHDDNK